MPETKRQEDKDREEKVNAILYNVEDAIKKGNLDDALEKIRRVYAYDIKNAYARAFEERILAMIVERGEKESQIKYEQQHLELKEEIDKKAQVEITRRLKDYLRQWEEETAKRKAKEQEDRELELRARKVSLDEQKEEGKKEYAALNDENRGRMARWERSMKEEVQSAIEKERTRLEKELAERLGAISATAGLHDATADGAGVSSLAQQAQMEADYAEKLLRSKEQMERDVQGKLETARVALHEEVLEKVRIENANVQEELRRHFELEKINWTEHEQVKMKERLLDVYKTIFIIMDVSMAPDRLDAILLSLRGILDISEAEHNEMRRSLQVNSYIDTLRASWQKGSLTNQEKDHLAHLCELYGISQEEHERLTKQVKRLLGMPEESASILAIDDSNDVLMFVNHVLKATYTNIRTASSVKEGVSKIMEEMPAVILSDVMMPEISGFAFYDMIQRGDYGEELKKVPFIFMSGCSDEYMKKIAEDLGVNRYLSKPFSKETLIKTVREILEKE
jgi:CheY-like chemotaxis protein